MYLITFSNSHHGRGDPPSVDRVRSSIQNTLKLIRLIGPPDNKVASFNDVDYGWIIPLTDEGLDAILRDYVIIICGDDDDRQCRTKEEIYSAPEDAEVFVIPKSGAYFDDNVKPVCLHRGHNDAVAALKTNLDNLDVKSEFDAVVLEEADLWADWYENFGKW